MSESIVNTYPDGVWETTGGLTDAEARMDWPVLRDAPGYQRRVTGPSGRVWTWRPWPRFPDAGNRREIPAKRGPAMTHPLPSEPDLAALERLNAILNDELVTFEDPSDGSRSILTTENYRLLEEAQDIASRLSPPVDRDAPREETA